MTWYYYGTDEGMYGPSTNYKIHSAKTLTSAFAGAYKLVKHGERDHSWLITFVRIMKTKTYNPRAAEYVVDVEYGTNDVFVIDKTGKIFKITSDGHIRKK